MGMKFRVLAGKYIQPDKTRPVNPTTGLLHDVVYGPGDIVEADSDLVARFNVGTARKFEQVHDIHLAGPSSPIPDGTYVGGVLVSKPSEVAAAAKTGFDPRTSNTAALPVEKSKDTLDTMDFAALKRFAAQEEIDLSLAKDATDARRIIRKAVKQ